MKVRIDSERKLMKRRTTQDASNADDFVQVRGKNSAYYFFVHFARVRKPFRSPRLESLKESLSVC